MTATGRHLTLLVPGLRPAEAHGLPPARLPDLETLLSRADRRRDDRRGLEAVLFERFDIASAADRDLPVAAVSYAADSGHAPAGLCLRADPVHLLPDRDHLVLLDSQALALQQAEADRLVAELNAVYAADGWRFEAPVAERWYLHLPDDPQLRTTPLPAVSGRAIWEHLPAGPRGKAWHRVMNEVQMLLHASGVNLAREAAGQLAVSGLWFWGGGPVPVVANRRWTRVWSGEATGRGLARLSQTPCTTPPRDAGQWLAEADDRGEHLLVFEGLQQALQTQGVEGWLPALEAFQRDWVSPLLSAVRNKQLTSLQLHGCDGQGYILTRAALRRWWRRRAPLLRAASGN